MKVNKSLQATRGGVGSSAIAVYVFWSRVPELRCCNMKPKHVYWASVTVWAVLCLCHLIVRTSAILSGPKEGDLYAYSWGFQSVVFLVLRFPLWCVVLGLMLALELWHFSRAKMKEIAAAPNGSPTMPSGNSETTEGPPSVL